MRKCWLFFFFFSSTAVAFAGQGWIFALLSFKMNIHVQEILEPVTALRDLEGMRGDALF